MFSPKEFLLTECENVRRLLQSTLRHAYSSKSIRDVYTECLTRLRLIESASRAIEEEDELHELWIQLSELNQLIGRVERSNIEEFPWPFGNELLKLAENICGISANKDTRSAPLFFISAADELSAYQILTEEGDPGLINRPLFNVIFPRSLKSFVLLHSILAHEVGHAAVAIPQLGDELVKGPIRKLISKSPLNDPSEFSKWLDNIGQPLEGNSRDVAMRSWPEELYCDLFGMLTMGPSFLGANCSLLQILSTDSASDSHPPSMTRYWMMQEAVVALGWHKEMARSRDLRESADIYFKHLSVVANKVPKKFRLLNSTSIKEATSELGEFLKPMGRALFVMPKAKTIADMVNRILRGRPPVASDVSASGKVTNPDADFRNTLFAGWMAWHSKRRDPKIEFLDINMLCDRGILQQSAVDHWKRSQDRGTEHGRA